MAPNVARELSDAMSHALRRRGPDGLGMYHDRDVLLVHRRLAIIDVTTAGTQPLWNEDETVCVIVNGELYNFREVRRSLESRGHRFRSRSDSEILVHLYEERGILGCCQAVHGMFAFALWDGKSRNLFLVRDRLGIKPLVVAEHEEGVTFGSSVASVLTDSAVPSDIRSEAIASLLAWGFVPSPWSAIRAVRHVGPGTYLRIRDGRVRETVQWWTDSPVHETSDQQAIRGALTNAIETHLIADVPIGALLSAGIDSGLVTALAVRASGLTLEAWTASHRGYPEDEYEEATRTAQALGVRLHEIAIGGSGLTEERLYHAVDAMDEPLGDSSLVPLHALFERISEDRRVVLSGDGGDELFGGYEWHGGLPQLPPWSQSWAFKIAATFLSRLEGWTGRLGDLGTVSALARQHPAQLYLGRLRIASGAELAALGLDRVRDDPVECSAIAAWDRFAQRGLLEQMLAADRATSLVDQMLAKLDTASMAHGVEARVPLLDDGVVGAAKALPATRKRHGSMGKVAMREWFGEVVSPELSQRPKTGFRSPIETWLEGPAREALDGSAHAAFPHWDSVARTFSPALRFTAAVLGVWLERVREREAPVRLRA